MSFRLLLLGVLCLASINVLALENVKLKGKITNRLSDSVSFTYDNGGFVYDPQTFATAIGKDGSFSVTFSVMQDLTSVYFNHGNQVTELIVQPGADLTLSVDGNRFDSSLHYEGKGKALANFMAKHMLELGTMVDITGRLYRQLGKNTHDFEKAVIDEQAAEYRFYKNNSAGLPRQFASYWQNYFMYSAYKVMLDYPVLHEMQRQQSYTLTGDVPKENYEVAALVPMAFNDSFINIPPYTQYVQGYFHSKLSAAGYNNITNDEDKKHRQDDSLLALIYKHAPPKTAEYVVAGFIYPRSDKTLPQRNEVLLASFKKHFPASKRAAILEARIKMLKKLSTGQPAPDFTFNTIEGREMKLSDLKGKVVLIDFWASWCGPCISQMPASKKLEEHFNGKNVVFLYISTDEDIAAWKKAIQKHDIKGLHTRVNENSPMEAAQVYGVNGIPSYFLVDKNGKFGPRDLPRPSDGDKLQIEIEKLLK